MSSAEPRYRPARHHTLCARLVLCACLLASLVPTAHAQSGGIFGVVSTAASVVVEASERSFLEGDGSDALFSISVLSGAAMPIAYPATWTLELELGDPRDVFLDDTLSVAPVSVSTMTRSGTGRGATVLTLTVPANTSSPITIGGDFAPPGGILHGPRTLSVTLRTVTDVANSLEIPSGRGSTASITVTDSDRPLVDLDYAVGESNTVAEGEETVLSISVSNSTSSADTNFRTASDNPGPIVVGVFSVYAQDAERVQVGFGGSCASPADRADYCIHLDAAAELGPGVRWTFMTFGDGDDARAYPVLTMDPGSTLQSTIFERVITVRALEDRVLERDERVRLYVVSDPRRLGQNPEDLHSAEDLGRSQDFTISGIAPGERPTSHIPVGELFYSVQPLALPENSTATDVGFRVFLVDAAGERWLYNDVSWGLELGALSTPEPRGLSDSELTELEGRFRVASLIPSNDDNPVLFRVGLLPGQVVQLFADDADAINEIAFLGLFENEAGSRFMDNPIPPHPILGMADRLPALRVHVDDDDALAAVQLQRYVLADDGTVVAAPRPGLDGTVIQGAAAFVSATVAAPNPLHAARRRSSFGVLFAPGRDPALAVPFESASTLLRAESSYHYVLLALSVGGAGSTTTFSYQTIDEDGILDEGDPGPAQALMDLRVGQWVDGRISSASGRDSDTAGDAQLLLLSNDPDFLSRPPAEAAPRRAELRRICPALIEAGLTSTTVGALAVADGSRYNAAAFHLLDVRRDGAYYGFRKGSVSVEVELLCASDPALSPDLADNSRPDGSTGAEFCATRMVGGRCLFDTTGARLDYQNYLPGFHDSGTVPLSITRAHKDVLLEPDDARTIGIDDARTRVTLTVQGIGMQLHADHGGGTVAFVPRAEYPGADTAAPRLELRWDASGGADAIAAKELAMSAHVTDPASTSSSLLVPLLPTPSGDELMLRIAVAARSDERYEHCLNHRFFADRDRDLGYLDTGSSNDLQLRTRRNLCRYTDDARLDADVRAQLEARGREPTFRLLPRLHYRAPGGAEAGATRPLAFPDNAFRVRDSDSYVRLVVSDTVLSEEHADSPVTVQVAFGGDGDTRYGDVADATNLLPVDLALIISGDAEGLGIRYRGHGLADPVVVPTSNASVEIEITLEDPGAHARSYDLLAPRGSWYDTSSPPANTEVTELLLFSDVAGASTATRYDLEADHSADPVLGKIVSMVRLRGLLPSRGPIDVMRIAAVDDDVGEETERFTVQLGILSASQSGASADPSSRTHSQRASRAGELARVLVDTSQGIERSYTGGLDDLRAAAHPARSRATIEIDDNDILDVIVRDNSSTVVIRENNLSPSVDPEGDDYQEELSSISVPNLTVADGNGLSGSGALLRVDLRSSAGAHRLPPGQAYEVLYHYTVPTTHTVRLGVDVRVGASVYLLLGDPELVEPGGACADRVIGLGTGNKQLIVAGAHPGLSGPDADIRDRLPDGGLGARLFFNARGNSEWFQGEGLFHYGVTLLCSDSTLFDPDRPATDSDDSFCISGGNGSNVVANDPVDGGAACIAHRRSRNYAVRDTNHTLVLSVGTSGGGGLNNFSQNLVASYDEPDAARPAIGRGAIPAVRNRFVTLGMHNRVTGQFTQFVILTTAAHARYVLPDLDDLFVKPFARSEGGAPFEVVLNSKLPSVPPEDEAPAWFRFSTRENDYLDGVDRVVELTLPINMLSDMPGRVAHVVIESGLDEDAPGYTDFVVGPDFSAAMRVRDSDNYYYYLGSDHVGLRLRERDDDSAAEPVTVVFGATRLGRAILDADPLLGEGIGMRIARLASGDSGNLPKRYGSATLDDLRLHNLDALPGPGASDPGSVLGPGSITETEIIAGQDNVRLVARSSTSSGFLNDTARVPFYFGARFDNGRMRLFDIGAARDGEPEIDEALDLVLDLRFLGRPVANADFGLHAESSAFFNGARSTVGTALPITIPLKTQTPYAALSASDGTNEGYSEPVRFTTMPYDPTLDDNDNGIPDHAEFSRYQLPDSIDTAVAGVAYAEAYCNDIMGDYDPALGALGDCDADGVPDVVELALGAPGAVSPVDEGLVQRVLCFAVETRTRLPLPEGVRLHCSDGGSALLGSPAMSAEWRIVLHDTRYRGTDYTLGTATADEAPGPNTGGLLPASYWMVDPGSTRLVHLMLLPRIELDVPAHVPVFTFFDYVDGGKVLHPELLGEPPGRQRFTHRGESYRGPGSNAEIYYAITDDSLDPARARSLPQAVGLRLFGNTAAVDELSYRVELQSSTATVPVPLSGQVDLQGGAIGASRARVVDVPLLTSSDLTFGPGAQRLGVVLRARSADLVLEQSLTAKVRGILQPDDDLHVRLSDRFYDNANTPRHAALAHFSAPGRSTDSATVFTLNVFGLRSRQLGATRLDFEVLNYATGRVAALGSSSTYRAAPDDVLGPMMGEIYHSQDISSAQLCAALSGCDFNASPFYLFELRGTIRMAGVAPFVEEETEMPPGNYQYTHNRATSGTVTEMVTITAANRPRVSVERRRGAGSDRVLTRVTQMVQLGGPVPSDSTDARSYADAD